jgi:hypothetical protein
VRLSGTEPVLKKISKPRPTPAYCGRDVRNEPSWKAALQPSSDVAKA